MKKKGLLVASGLTVVAAGLVVGAANANVFNFAKTNAQQLIDLDTEEITRRIWIVNQDDWGWEHYYVYARNANDHTKFANVAFTGWVDFTGETMYYHGLAYADVTFVGAGGNIDVIVKNAEDDSGTETAFLELGSLESIDGDVIWILAGLQDGKRNASIGTAPMSTGQLAKALATIHTCQDGFNDGYNAYPQLDKDFFIPSATAIADYGDGTYVEDGYKLTQKIAKLESLFDTNGWYTEEVI